MAPSPTSPVLCSPWATIDDVPQRVLDELEAEGITIAEELPPALLIASEILWMLSGRVWYGGGCEEDATLISNPPGGLDPYPYHGSWGRCGCWGLHDPATWAGRHVTRPVTVMLPRSPITSVEAVTIDGEPFAAWRLLRSGWLERTDGHGWAVCDGLTSVTYQFGEPPPAAGVQAAVDFGVEMARSRAGLDSCKLPPNVVSISRQGVTMELEASDARAFRTGLFGVDLWLDAVNPSQRVQGARIWSPDVPSTRRGATREV